MSQEDTINTPEAALPVHRRFANMYERTSNGKSEVRFINPMRQNIIERARGYVLEVGAGNGLNFAFYDPARIERVEAIEPDAAMLGYAQQRVQTAHVPITLTQAVVEKLPFADATFDSVVVTLVFCSVTNPLQGLQEIKRVLKPGGNLLMVEHVRSHNTVMGHVQDILVPFTTRLLGNCHWNRDTLRTVRSAGFQIDYQLDYRFLVMPFILLEAKFPPLDQQA